MWWLHVPTVIVLHGNHNESSCSKYNIDVQNLNLSHGCTGQVVLFLHSSQNLCSPHWNLLNFSSLSVFPQPSHLGTLHCSEKSKQKQEYTLYTYVDYFDCYLSSNISAWCICSLMLLQFLLIVSEKWISSLMCDLIFATYLTNRYNNPLPRHHLRMSPISLLYSDVTLVTGYIIVISLLGVWSCTLASGYPTPMCKTTTPQGGI